MQLGLTNLEKVEVPEIKLPREIHTNITEIKVDALDTGYDEMIPS